MAKEKATVSNELHELQTVVDAMAKKGIKIELSDVLKAKETVGNMRREVYAYLENSINGSDSI